MTEKQLKTLEESLRLEADVFIKRTLQVVKAMAAAEKEETGPKGHAPETSAGSHNQFDNFPNVLTPKQIAAMLGVPLSKAYELVHHHECPKNPRLKKTQVFKADFLAWFFADSATHGELLKGGVYD